MYKDLKAPGDTSKGPQAAGRPEAWTRPEGPRLPLLGQTAPGGQSQANRKALLRQKATKPRERRSCRRWKALLAGGQGHSTPSKQHRPPHDASPGALAQVLIW